jgi:hypothetical protein
MIVALLPIRTSVMIGELVPIGVIVGPGMTVPRLLAPVIGSAEKTPHARLSSPITTVWLIVTLCQPGNNGGWLPNINSMSIGHMCRRS